MAAVTAISALAASVLAYLASRDKLRFDTDMAGLRLEVKECHEDREELVRRLEGYEARVDEAEKIAASVRGELKSMEREVNSLKLEVTELRDRLYGRPK